MNPTQAGLYPCKILISRNSTLNITVILEGNIMIKCSENGAIEGNIYSLQETRDFCIQIWVLPAHFPHKYRRHITHLEEYSSHNSNAPSIFTLVLQILFEVSVFGPQKSAPNTVLEGIWSRMFDS